MKDQSIPEKFSSGVSAPARSLRRLRSRYNRSYLLLIAYAWQKRSGSGDTLGNQIWADWNKAPFAVSLVTPEYEFLIRHPKPSSDFVLVNYDPLLKSKVYYRQRTQAQNLLATFHDE